MAPTCGDLSPAFSTCFNQYNILYLLTLTCICLHIIVYTVFLCVIWAQSQAFQWVTSISMWTQFKLCKRQINWTWECIPWLITAFSRVTLVMKESGATQKSLAV